MRRERGKIEPAFQICHYRRSKCAMKGETMDHKIVENMGTAEKSRASSRTLDMVQIALFAVLIAICSWISVPTVVPFTLQTFGVFMACGVLGGKKGTMAVLIYILLGVIGIPVFAGFTGGVGVLLRSTGGYIVGFLFSALVMWAVEAAFGRKPVVRVAGMLLGLLVCYLLGTIWFMILYSRTNGPVGIGTVLGWCVIPFIIPDCIKIALAAGLAPQIRRYTEFQKRHE